MNLFRSNGHLSDETLLLLQDCELSQTDEQRADAHLESCDECRSRMASMSAETTRLNDALQSGSQSIPPADLARTRLQMSLAQQMAAASILPWRRPASMLRSPLVWRVAAVAALLLLAVTFRQAYRPLQDRMAAYEETGPEPDHALTPGATNPVEVAQLCSESDDDLDPQLPPEKVRAVFRAYGMDEKTSRSYQVDYLINPQLGGNDQMENLWPEPYHATVWNASAKDALETRLHKLVCDQQIDLETAQRELSTDWIAAYKKYFHSARPVSTVATVDRSVMAELP